MDIRFEEFEPIRVVRNLPECDLLANPLLTEEEREYAAKFYDFIERELDADITTLQNLNYFVEEPTQDQKAKIVVKIVEKLARSGFYSTIPEALNFYRYPVGGVMRNVIIAFILCCGKWSEAKDKYVGGNWSVEMTRLAGGTLYCNPVAYRATEEQKRRLLYPVARDGAVAASAMTEFEAGSDIAHMNLSIREDGSEVVLDGKKIFITNGPLAKYVLVYGRMEDGALGSVVVDTKDQTLEGFEATRLRTYGMTDAFVSRLVFDGVRVPKEDVLEGHGLDTAFHQLTEERVVIAAEALGDVAKKLLFSHSFAIHRKQFGRRLHENQVIRMPITANARALRQLTDSLINFARLMDSVRGEDPHLRADFAQKAMGLKIDATELAFDASIHCFRTMGGRGFTRQYAVPIGFLDAYCMIHGGGSNYVLQDSESRREFRVA
ncbi:MAG: acyl-CoA dehydrogenase family protein [Promethearchaeota archaeon]